MICEENNRPLKTISPESMLRLQRYEWPGNVRQLRNVLEGMIIMTPEDHIDIEHLPEPVRETSGAASLESVISACMPLAAIEREVICRTLERTGGNRTETSKILGVSSRTLQRRIKEYDLPY
jgi:two-component system response regulator HydG